jgi:hypothetical protein
MDFPCHVLADLLRENELVEYARLLPVPFAGGEEPVHNWLGLRAFRKSSGVWLNTSLNGLPPAPRSSASYGVMPSTTVASRPSKTGGATIAMRRLATPAAWQHTHPSPSIERAPSPE